jgi:hypothetical protein
VTISFPTSQDGHQRILPIHRVLPLSKISKPYPLPLSSSYALLVFAEPSSPWACLCRSRELAWPPIMSALISLAVVCKYTSLGLGRARGKESRGRYLSRRSRQWKFAIRTKALYHPKLRRVMS